ncbi:MAG: hypothetical protein Q9207_006533 [Kuettlingeria erythrocarpa]
MPSRPRETITLLSHHHPPNIPGKSLVTLLVTLPPNAATPPHTHGGAAVLALMLRGASRDQMNAEKEPTVRGAGETFYEAPGCHHVKGENACETDAEGEGDETQFYAVFIVDDEYLAREGYNGLLVLDAEVEVKGKKAEKGGEGGP